jgi:hypothetical protein
VSAGGSIRRACFDVFNRQKIVMASGLASKLFTIILFTILMSNAQVNLKNSATYYLMLSACNGVDLLLGVEPLARQMPTANL